MEAQDPADGQGRRRLGSWGEIADYLGVDIATVHRWETWLELPVHRGTGGHDIVAFTDELDAWREAHHARIRAATYTAGGDRSASDREFLAAAPEPAEPAAPGAPASAVEPSSAVASATEAPAATAATRAGRGWGDWALAVGAVAVIGGVVYLVTVSRPAPMASRVQPASLVLQGNSLVALDAAAHQLWSHDFREPTTLVDASERPRLQPWWRRMDANGDGTEELMVLLRHAGAAETLYCFALDGRRRYAYRPALTLAFRQATYAGPWLVWDFEPVVEDRAVWVAVAHNPWWPSAVVRLDGQGEATTRYVQPGHVRRLAVVRWHGRTLVLAGGVNNEYGSASLALLDPQAPPVSAPQREESGYACRGCPHGYPLAYFLFPTTPFALADGLPYNRVKELLVGPDGAEVMTEETGQVAMWYTVTADARVVSARPSDGYLAWTPTRGAQHGKAVTLPPTAAVRVWERGAWSTQEVAYEVPQMGKPPEGGSASLQAPRATQSTTPDQNAALARR